MSLFPFKCRFIVSTNAFGSGPLAAVEGTAHQLILTPGSDPQVLVEGSDGYLRMMHLGSVRRVEEPTPTPTPTPTPEKPKKCGLEWQHKDMTGDATKCGPPPRTPGCHRCVETEFHQLCRCACGVTEGV